MRSPRRYYLLKLLSARRLGREEGVWLSKLRQYPGTLLPPGFPSRAQLLSAGYTAVEEVDGATPLELAQFARLSASAAGAAIAAAAASILRTPMQDAQGNYHAYRETILLSLVNFREATTGDVGAIAAVGGLLSSDTTPALSGTGATVSQQVSWATGNVDQILIDVALPEDFDGRDDVTVELFVSSGTTNPASFTVLTSWDGGANVSDTATDAAQSATVHKISATIAAADIPDGAAFVSLALVPAAHATDAIVLKGIRLLYMNRVMAA